MIRRWLQMMRDGEQLLSRSSDLLYAAVQRIDFLEQELVRMQEAHLMQERATHDILVGWRIAIEQPEIDVRDDLDALIERYADNIAIITEHVA